MNQKSQPNKNELNKKDLKITLVRALANANKLENQASALFKKIDQTIQLLGALPKQPRKRKPKNQPELFELNPTRAVSLKKPLVQIKTYLQPDQQLNRTEPTSSQSSLPAENKNAKDL